MTIPEQLKVRQSRGSDVEWPQCQQQVLVAGTTTYQTSHHFGRHMQPTVHSRYAATAPTDA